MDGPDDRSGEAVCDHVGLAGDVSDVCGVLGDVGKLALLGRPRFSHLGHAERERLVVHKSGKFIPRNASLGHSQDAGGHAVWVVRVPADAVWSEKCCSDLPAANGFGAQGDALDLRLLGRHPSRQLL